VARTAVGAVTPDPVGFLLVADHLFHRLVPDEVVADGAVALFASL
jgi:hypothetical protein